MSLSTNLSVPQVANVIGLQQENVIGVEGRGSRLDFSGFGVQLMGPSHLEEPGAALRVDHPGSTCAPLQTGTYEQTPNLKKTKQNKKQEQSLSLRESNLEDDEFAFENSQEMAGLLSHDHPDLDWGAVVLVIDSDGLIGARCHLIFGGMASLVKHTHTQKKIPKGFMGKDSNLSPFCPG